MNRTARIFGWLIIVLAFTLGISAFVTHRDINSEARAYVTETLAMGEVMQTIAANGTVNPVTMVNVGTQISGTVRKIEVDHNSSVQAGQILAQLDDRLIRAQLAQDEAKVAGAEAQLRIAELKAERLHGLKERVSVSGLELDEAQYEVDAARAEVTLAQAQLQLDLTNLEYTVIRSPINGVVVDRSVDVGQTVAASFQTPTLFLIAGNLGRMQIDSNVSEADVGAIRVGMRVTFSVDAFPSEVMEGRVKQIRLNPKVQQNVVTYNVVVDVGNDSGKLLPGMTANLSFIATHIPRALRIPNAALRYRPQGFETPPQSPGEAMVFFGCRVVNHNPS